MGAALRRCHREIARPLEKIFGEQDLGTGLGNETCEWGLGDKPLGETGPLAAKASRRSVTQSEDVDRYLVVSA